MKLHIENLNITYQLLPVGPLSTLTIAKASTNKAKGSIPAIGEKWPGLEAVYAGTALSQTEDCLVHLILWVEDAMECMKYDKAVKWAENVNPELSSHIPTRHQSITLFERLRDHHDTDYWHWTLTKTMDGKAAFGQHFYCGDQNLSYLSSDGRVRAVSEIPL